MAYSREGGQLGFLVTEEIRRSSESTLSRRWSVPLPPPTPLPRVREDSGHKLWREHWPGFKPPALLPRWPTSPGGSSEKKCH